MPAASAISLANCLLPSSRAASAVGPQQRMPCSCKASARPNTSGASGPGTTRSMAFVAAKAVSASTSSAGMGTSGASSAIPALPGAHQRPGTTGVRAIARTSACSRPPEPTTRTRIRPSCPSGNLHVGAPLAYPAAMPETDDSATLLTGNIPEYSVGEISAAVKRTLEGAFGRVRVRGEITEFKRYASGHMYFSLKDENGKLAGIVWKGSVSRLGLVPENGVEVIATGRITAYGERSSYQMIVERMEYAGAGALLARIELLRQRLATEGLFDVAGKRAIPLLPEVIGVVTSEQGAVLQDIRTTVARRFPRQILLWPVAVQGEGAAARIAAAIAGFSAMR